MQTAVISLTGRIEFDRPADLPAMAPLSADNREFLIWLLTNLRTVGSREGLLTCVISLGQADTARFHSLRRRLDIASDDRAEDENDVEITTLARYVAEMLAVTRAVQRDNQH